MCICMKDEAVLVVQTIALDTLCDASTLKATFLQKWLISVLIRLFFLCLHAQYFLVQLIVCLGSDRKGNIFWVVTSWWLEMEIFVQDIVTQAAGFSDQTETR